MWGSGQATAAERSGSPLRGPRAATLNWKRHHGCYSRQRCAATSRTERLPIWSPIQPMTSMRILHLLLLLLVAGVIDLSAEASGVVPRRKHSTGNKANIVLIVTDDQDIELGSMNYMPHVRRHIEREGAYFPHAYVTTPMCCPSRSSLLTGLYVHNHNVYTNNKNCSSPQWQRTFEPRTFAAALQRAGYQTGYFGKYLNEYNGNHVPVGWKEWLGLVRNSKFYNYTVSVNGNKVKHGDSYKRDYFPDLVTNQSLSFLRRSKQFYPSRPVLMVMAFPGPHGPEDSAPQYQHLFRDETNHRTPSWNYAPNYDKQWILQHTNKMQNIHIKFTDILNTKRLQTLQTVDEAVNRLIEELRRLNELDNTFIIYTSDHGYHLGQFGLVKGKAMPFEFDVRVPFYVRGPKISKGIQVPELIANIDIAPTLLEIAGVPADVSMDGKSILPLLMQKMGRRVTTWRDSVLIEKGKLSSKEREAFIMQPLAGVGNSAHHSGSSASFNDAYSNNNNSMWNLSSKSSASTRCLPGGKYPSPCKPGQRFECVQQTGMGVSDDQHGTLVRCSQHNRNRKQRCRCRSSSSTSYPFPTNVGSFSSRNKFVMDDDLRRFHTGGFRRTVAGHRRQLARSRREYLMQRMSLRRSPPSIRLGAIDETFEDRSGTGSNDSGTGGAKELVSCVQFSKNQSVICLGSEDEAYTDPLLWQQKKERVDVLIKRFRHKLNQLKGLRTTLRRYRPPGSRSSFMSSSNQRHANSAGNNADRSDFATADVDDQGLDGADDVMARCSCRERLTRKRLRKKEKFANTSCNTIAQDIDKMNCFSHDNNHWKTPPLWTDGPFCFCQNANNNTFWCVRTVNRTHNFLYCEFVTGFTSFYDLRTDPYQLKNVIDRVPRRDLEQMRTSLKRLRRCKGARECTVRYRPSRSLQLAHHPGSPDVSPARPFISGPSFSSKHRPFPQHYPTASTTRYDSPSNTHHGSGSGGGGHSNITMAIRDNLLRRNINTLPHEQHGNNNGDGRDNNNSSNHNNERTINERHDDNDDDDVDDDDDEVDDFNEGNSGGGQREEGEHVGADEDEE